MGMAQKSLLLMLAIGPNKLECYITLGWKGLLVSNISKARVFDTSKPFQPSVDVTLKLIGLIYELRRNEVL
jgi:hypothetical protein